MFQEGDLIIYGNDGVCRVEEICKLNMSGIDDNRLYYVLKPLYVEGKIYAPTETNAFMRKIISYEFAQQLIEQIPSIEVEVFNSNRMQEINDHYRSSFKTHDCEDLMKLIKNVYVKKGIAENNKKKLGKIDENYMKKAEDLLYGEFAAALKIPKENVKNYIEKRIEELEYIV
ncbi:MAG: hypothetical protein K0Q97_2444 [Bacillota bacterium]|nr:hypothetical protein [Bacillota bacterium]